MYIGDKMYPVVPKVLDQGGKEYTQGVFGERLSKTDASPKAVRDESLLLQKLPSAIFVFLEEPLRAEGCRVVPVVRVLREDGLEETLRKYFFMTLPTCI